MPQHRGFYWLLSYVIIHISVFSLAEVRLTVCVCLHFAHRLGPHYVWSNCTNGDLADCVERDLVRSSQLLPFISN